MDKTRIAVKSTYRVRPQILEFNFPEANGGNNNKAIIGTSTSTGGIGINGFVTGAINTRGTFENTADPAPGTVCT